MPRPKRNAQHIVEDVAYMVETGETHIDQLARRVNASGRTILDAVKSQMREGDEQARYVYEAVNWTLHKSLAKKKKVEIS
jgi:hypothetical protein